MSYNLWGMDCAEFLSYERLPRSVFFAGLVSGPCSYRRNYFSYPLTAFFESPDAVVAVNDFVDADALAVVGVVKMVFAIVAAAAAVAVGIEFGIDCWGQAKQSGEVRPFPLTVGEFDR